MFDRKKWRAEWNAKNPDKAGEQLKRDNAARRTKKFTETPEEKEARLAAHRARHKAWRDRNQDKIKAYVAKDRSANMDRVRIQQRNRTLSNKYGITLDDYDGMLARQGRRCAICASEKATARHSHFNWRVDHCHVTGKVRALLCHNCNIALGLLKEDISTLEKMINYLKYHKIT